MINKPNKEIVIPATALRLCSVRKLTYPRIRPSTLVIPPQTGMMAVHKLSIPNAGEAIAKNRALRNSGSRLLGSVSIWCSKRATELY